MSQTVSGKQQDAIAALLTGSNVVQAAAAAGVSRATLHRWLADDAFRAALVEAETAAWQSLARALAGCGELAAKALRDALGEEQTIATRLRAVDMLLARGPAIAELVTLLARVEALEQQIGGAE